MKKTLLISLCTLFTINSYTQNNTILPVNFNTGSVIYQNNLSSYISSAKKEKTIQNKYYKWVQFNTIPTQSQKQKMVELGMNFIEYVPKNTYLVSFPKNFNKTLLSNFNISSVNKIEDKNRITERATNSQIPEWAYEEGKVLIYLSFYNDLNFNFCIRKLVREEIEIKTKDVFTNNVLIRVEESKIHELLNNKSIRLIDLTPEPGKPEHDLSRNMHRSTSINTRYATGRKYDGTGVAVCINDDGIVGPHIDFTGRINQSGVTSNLGTHGDMTTGIVGGAGNINPTYVGMAPGASIYVRQYNSSLPNTVTLHTTDSVQIFSSSYSNGCNAGYTSLARKVDQEIRQNPSLIQIFSAGNSNNNDCGYGAGNQWGNITGGHKQAKNVIACANLYTNTTLINSSSRGPAEDGRIKPDISSNGNGNISTAPNNAYLTGSGTSAAAPGVAGVMTQLYHAHRVLKGFNPESALMKAIILNSAEDYGNVGPDFKYGWGRVNALRAVKTLENTNYFDATITQGNNNNHPIVIPANVKQVKIMVYWHDYEASTSASKALVNDLNSKITQGSSTYLPYLLDHTATTTALNTPATTGVDSINNVEQISILNPTAGTYALNVHGKSVPQGPQKYYVVYEFIKDEITLINPNGGEGHVPGETIRVFWDAYGNTGNFSLKYSTNKGATWNTISSSIPGANRYYDWAIPNNVTGKALVKLERGTAKDSSNHTFTIIGKPNNLQVIKMCPNYMEVSWTAVSGADQYQVFLLGNKYMDSVGRTLGTTFQIPITNPLSEKWFSVAAIKNKAEGNVGRRANAKYYAGGLFNCPQPIDAGISKVLSPSNSSCNPSSTVQLQIIVNNYGTASLSSIPVKYQINGGAIVIGNVTASIPSLNNTNYTFTSGYTFSTGITYQIKVWTEMTGDVNNSNDTISISYLHAANQNIPFNEDFDGFTNCSKANDCEVTVCGLTNSWTNLESGSEDDIDWRVNSGGTNSGGTGPSGDNTSGSGKYLYIESSGCYNKIAQVLSPCIHIGPSIGYPQLSFYYNMRGSAGMDSLTVDIFNGTTWINGVYKTGGAQGSNWKRATVSLVPFSGNTIKIRFNGNTGGDYQTDIAIDDINISDAVSLNENDLSNSISIFPNPNNGEFKIEILDNSLKNVSVKIVDVSGRLIHSQKINSKLNTIDLKGIAPGIYTISLISEGKRYSQLIVVE